MNGSIAAPVQTDGVLRLATAAMGTRFELVIDAPQAERFRAAAEEAMACIEDCHRRYSRFAPDSLTSHINREAVRRPVRVDADTWRLLADAATVQRASGGAFSILAEAGATAADSALTLDDAARSVRLAKGVAIDLGGIAKGHAIDLAVRGLRAQGIGRALLHGGTSSIAAIGAPSDGDAWCVAFGPGAGAPVLRLRDACLSVSATGPGPAAAARPHPVLDPRSGTPVDRPLHVAVTGPRCVLTDAWATALVVLGRLPPTMPAGYVARFRGPEE